MICVLPDRLFYCLRSIPCFYSIIAPCHREIIRCHESDRATYFESRIIRMSFIGDKAEEMAEKKVFAEGGYPALIKFKAVRLWDKITSCCN
mmetsp:Transcript_29341/g.86956  ORF Transcript_29341/g.86956 Transcript_29341/m.86956 type:complete len:91 (+) Transcript_29341:508-780(+)